MPPKADAIEGLELSMLQAAALAGVSFDSLDKWATLGLLNLKVGPSGRGKARVVHEPALAAILLVKLLRSRDVPIELIRPASLYLSSLTREEIERRMDAGETVLFAAGDRVQFARPDGMVKNDSGKDVMRLAVDLTSMLRAAWRAIEKHNGKTQHHRN